MKVNTQSIMYFGLAGRLGMAYYQSYLGQKATQTRRIKWTRLTSG